MKLEQYQPSDWIRDNSRYACPGIGKVIRAMQDMGYIAVVDFEDYREKINSKTARYACHEMDITRILFGKVGEDRRIKYVCSMLVIPADNEEWLCDYTVNPDMEKAANLILRS